MLFRDGRVALHTLSLFNVAGTDQNNKQSVHHKSTSFDYKTDIFRSGRKFFIAQWDKFLFG